ncbi:leukocyte elastase inhibitor isoform X3 [Aplysia californica]|uniref:Leukocyte elastase inhibitor isoform X3 n=1 Tax=Aplysia californica TaxID=6500 RepID=A0ABM0JFG4_APLCA|nr:leukocyte elastase inhibitor isoform X3 [Aplysia californica]
MATTEIASTNNMFGLQLFKTIFEENKDKNTFLSPFSISVALAMTQLGARGKTASDMSATLQWNANSEQAIHDGYQSYISKLQQPCDKYQLSTANRIFIEKNYPVLAEFIEKTKKFYLAEPVSADFGGDSEKERTNINSWVSEQTQNKINDLLPRGAVDALTRMVLVNAIYFKGKWDEEFNPNLTRPLPFKVSPSNTKDVPMMFAKRKFAFFQDESLACTAIEIPYKGKDLGMVVILPNDDFGLEALVKTLTPEKLTGLLGRLGKPFQEVKLTLPKFEVSCSFQLKPLLSALGMAEAFNVQNADFSGMTEGEKRDLVLDEVYHNAFVKVNEEGTEAAAATAVVMMRRCAPLPTDNVVVDRPFLFAIFDKVANGNMIFLGQVVDPSA